MIRYYHMALDIRGWLMNHTRKRDYHKMFRHDDGRFMSPEEAKAELLNQLTQGRKLLPYGACNGFSYETGCPGHSEAASDGPIAMMGE